MQPPLWNLPQRNCRYWSRARRIGEANHTGPAANASTLRQSGNRATGAIWNASEMADEQIGDSRDNGHLLEGFANVHTGIVSWFIVHENPYERKRFIVVHVCRPVLMNSLHLQRKSSWQWRRWHVQHGEVRRVSETFKIILQELQTLCGCAAFHGWRSRVEFFRSPPLIAGTGIAITTKPIWRRRPFPNWLRRSRLAQGFRGPGGQAHLTNDALVPQPI